MSSRETGTARVPVEHHNPRKRILSILCPTKFRSTLPMAHRYR